MTTPPSIPCTIHGVDFTTGFTMYIEGQRPRRHLRCEVIECATRKGKHCARCYDFVVNTQRRPEHDRDTHDPRAIFAAWICPVCGHNQFEVEFKAGAAGQAV